MKNNFVFQMKIWLVEISLVLIFFTSNSFAQSKELDKGNNYIFYLHNKFPEEHALDEPHPDYGIVDKIITLDNRRMALPRTDNPRVYTLRSSDQVADKDVLPTEEEVKKYKSIIINLKNTTHNQMDNTANETQRIEINNYILDFLNENK